MGPEMRNKALEEVSEQWRCSKGILPSFFPSSKFILAFIFTTNDLSLRLTLITCGHRSQDQLNTKNAALKAGMSNETKIEFRCELQLNTDRIATSAQ